MSDNVTKLLDEVNKLSAEEKNNLLIEVFKNFNLLQLKDFKDLFCKTFDVSAVAAAAPMMAVPAAAQKEEAAEPTEFNVVITSAGPNKIQVIKSVREVTGLGLKEAKQLVDTVPQPVKEKVSKEEAQKIKENLDKSGATVEIKGI